MVIVHRSPRRSTIHSRLGNFFLELASDRDRKTLWRLSLGSRDFFEKNRQSTVAYECKPFEATDLRPSNIVHAVISP
jgi:hypothetical protein